MLKQGKLTAEDILRILIDVSNDQNGKELVKLKITKKDKVA